MHPLRTRAVVLAAGLALAACSGGGGDSAATLDLAAIDVVATVDGQDITGEALEDRVAPQRPLATEGLEGEAAAQAEAELVRQALTAEIQFRLVVAAAAEMGVEVSDEELDEAYAAAVERSGGEEAFQQILDEQGLDEATARDSVRVDTLVGELRETLVADVEVDDEAVEQAYEERLDTQFTTSTVRHILLETEEEAEAALQRLEDGEEFAEVAMEVSTGPSGPEGGLLGAQPRGAYVEPFEETVWAEDTEVGEVYGPVETEFGFHLIRVDERTTLTFEEVEEQLRDELASGDVDAAFQAFLDDAFAAEVTVDERIGVWNPETTTVVAEVPADGFEEQPAEVPDGE